MSKPLPETMRFCKYTNKWIITENPKKCATQDYDCDNCEHCEKRVLNKYIIKKLRKLEKENKGEI